MTSTTRRGVCGSFPAKTSQEVKEVNTLFFTFALSCIVFFFGPSASRLDDDTRTLSQAVTRTRVTCSSSYYDSREPRHVSQKPAASSPKIREKKKIMCFNNPNKIIILNMSQCGYYLL